jgi:hypothetical protein
MVLEENRPEKSNGGGLRTVYTFERDAFEEAFEDNGRTMYHACQNGKYGFGSPSFKEFSNSLFIRYQLV